MKKVQFSYLPADSAAAGNSRETKKNKQVETSKAPAPPDEATVARLNALAREYPFCAYRKAKDITVL